MKIANKKFINPDLLLILAFVLIMAFEIYLLHQRLYDNLTTEVANIQTDSVVRLDLPSYTKTLQILDDSKSFTPKLNLTNTNPFK
jgi:hypothetical protein